MSVQGVHGRYKYVFMWLTIVGEIIKPLKVNLLLVIIT